jgi:hypothetical protein
MRWSALLLLFLAGLAFADNVLGDDLVALSDEFNDASTLSQWQRIYAVEGWNANQLEKQDINTTRAGRMFMEPYTSTWYNDYRGELTFKTVTGDFVVTTDVEVTSRTGSGAPHSQYSLAGIMIRAPRNITAQTWQPGGENYVFLSLGAASNPGTFQNEVKTTVNSLSTLPITSAPSGHMQIQVARIGPFVITLRNSDGTWVVHRRFFRGDFPQTMQVGMTVYTDFGTCSTFVPVVHNGMVIKIGNPDLLAYFDFFHFVRPVVPASLANLNLADSNVVTDAQLLAFLGAHADGSKPSHRRAVGH